MKTMNIQESIIDHAVDVLINTRDFCGNEKEAVIDLASDYGIKGKDAIQLYKIANFRANKQWNGYQKQAGVNPKYRMI